MRHLSHGVGSTATTGPRELSGAEKKVEMGAESATI